MSKLLKHLMETPTLQKPVREMFKEAVQATEAVLLSKLQLVDPDIEHINFICGPPDEVIETLQEMSTTQKHQLKKYPLVALLEDIGIQIGRKTGYFGTTTVNFIIATQTEALYKSDERETKSFIPILRPT